MQVYRNRRWVKISSDEVLPGELVSVKSAGNDDAARVPCDLLLVRGRCIVDESMLTGESVPQPKVPAFSHTRLASQGLIKNILRIFLLMLLTILVAYACLRSDLK